MNKKQNEKTPPGKDPAAEHNLPGSHTPRFAALSGFLNKVKNGIQHLSQPSAKLQAARRDQLKTAQKRIKPAAEKGLQNNKVKSRGLDRLLNALIDKVFRKNPNPESLLSVYFDGLFYKNPVVVDFVGLTLIVAAGNTMKSALLLSLAVLIVLVFVTQIASLTYRFIPSFVRPAVYTLIAGVIILPIQILYNFAFPEASLSINLFLPLIAVNGLNLSRIEQFSSKNNCLYTFIDAVGKASGFVLVILFVSIVREILGCGTFFDLPVPFFSETHSAVFYHVPGGFLILAACAALIQFVKMQKQRKETESK